MDIDGTSDTVNIIAIATVSAALIVQTIIGGVTCRGMYRNETGVELKVLFILSVLIACTTSISCIVGNALEMATGVFPAYTFTIAYSGTLTFFSLLLMTLVLRLRVTFKDSIYRMSNCTYCVFIGSFILNVCDVIDCWICSPFILDSHWKTRHLGWSSHVFLCIFHWIRIGGLFFCVEPLQIGQGTRAYHEKPECFCGRDLFG